MKYFYANIFNIIPLSDVESINGNTIITKAGATMDLVLTRSDLEFVENLTESGANDYYTQQCAPISHPISDTLRNKYRKKKVIIQLRTTQGKIFTWGSMELPVRAVTNSELNADKFIFKRNSPIPLL